jgi:hypothetical protein
MPHATMNHSHGRAHRRRESELLHVLSGPALQHIRLGFVARYEPRFSLALT